MENTFTKDELKEALLAALIDFETLKKTRRTNAVKKTLQSTMVATLIGSTGLMAAGHGRHNNRAKETTNITATRENLIPPLLNPQNESKNIKFIPGVVHFGFNKHALSSDQKERLLELINQIPKQAEVTVIGRTDSAGSKRYNEKLGQRRAQSVADFLMLNGIKVRYVASRISNNLPENWMKRRTDIIVDSGQTAFYLKPTPANDHIASQHPAPQPVAQQKPNLDAFGFRSNLTPTARELAGENKTSSITEINSDEITSITSSAEPEFPVYQRQRVRGASHFASTSYELVWEQKERLIDLIKQLPKDAQLTVIGRTESNGAEDSIKDLGMQRAKTVATFLTSFGVKVKAVGSKQSSDRFTGWGARRVDIVVDSGSTQKTIDMTQSAKQSVTNPNNTQLILKPKDSTVQHSPYLYRVN